VWDHCHVDGEVAFPSRRLLNNTSAKLMWFTYCGSESSVDKSVFVAAVRKYLEEMLHMSEEQIAGLVLEDYLLANLGDSQSVRRHDAMKRHHD
jgi:hypothetical protein